MFRVPFLAGFAVVSLVSTGCAGALDTITSRRFREQPWQTTKRMWSPEDPLVILLADPPREGDDRAAAMRRLKEPIWTKASPEARDAVMALLEKAAISDPSPVLRMEAVEVLGRLGDPRAAGILMVAYQNAHGRRPGDPLPTKTPTAQEILQTGASAGRTPTRLLDPFPTTTGPSGFAPDWVTTIRCRAAESLGQTHSAEGAKFLAVVAGGAGPDLAIDGGDEREIRLAAIRGLGQSRQPEAVVALAQVLTAEADKKDTAVIGRTHDGLVRLTGKKLPPDPQTWNEVVQAGVVIAPEPSWFDNAIEQVSWVWKK